MNEQNKFKLPFCELRKGEKCCSSGECELKTSDGKCALAVVVNDLNEE